MKITASWIPAGQSQSVSLVLADSPANIPLTNLRINGARNIQEAQFFRAVARGFYDRGNRKNEVSFDATRLQKDQSTAENFVLFHETQLPSGLVLLTFVTGPGSGASTTAYLPGAAVQAVDSHLRGCTTFHSYKFTGGIFSTQPA